MESALVDWSRAQFALTACYHWLFVPLTLGLSVIMAVMETIYVIRKVDFWKHTARFWMKIFGINFALGVATGIILEFEFGTNFSNYSWFVGDIFGAPLAIEGIFAFFIEATFIAVMLFGWGRVSKGFHLASTWLTAFGASLSALWILIANGWMQHPVGMVFNPDTVRNEMVDFWAVVSNPVAVSKFFHSVLCGWMTGAVVVIGISSWYLLRRREQRFALGSIRVAAVVGIVGTVALMFSGDRSAVHVAEYQPMKLAADFDGHVPGIQDILDGYVDGNGTRHPSATEMMARGDTALSAFRTYREAKGSDPELAAAARATLMENAGYFGYGYISSEEELVPPVGLVYWAFRVMVGLGCFLLLVMILAFYYVRRETLEKNRWFLWICVLSIPLVYLSGQAGWIVAEVGRQPWAIQGLLPVKAGVSSVSVGAVQTTFFLFLGIFTLFLAIEIRILIRTIRKGPGNTF